jgi:hypothetical protein
VLATAIIMTPMGDDGQSHSHGATPWLLLLLLLLLLLFPFPLLLLFIRPATFIIIIITAAAVGSLSASLSYSFYSCVLAAPVYPLPSSTLPHARYNYHPIILTMLMLVLVLTSMPTSPSRTNKRCQSAPSPQLDVLSHDTLLLPRPAQVSDPDYAACALPPKPGIPVHLWPSGILGRPKFSSKSRITLSALRLRR